MAVTPSQDKKAFWKRIRYDPEILRLMGWENVSPVEFPDLILTKRAIPGILKASDRYICIYNTSGKRTYDTAFSSPVCKLTFLFPIRIVTGRIEWSNVLSHFSRKILKSITATSYLILN